MLTRCFKDFEWGEGFFRRWLPGQRDLALRLPSDENIPVDVTIAEQQSMRSVFHHMLQLLP